MAPPPRVLQPPPGGLWRVGRSPNPLHFADPLDPDLLHSRVAGNRFDSPTQDYRVCYFATRLEGCFGETLSRFRIDPLLSSVAHEEGFMAAGEVPADWRHRRLAVRVKLVASDEIPKIGFLDVEAAETRAMLREEIGDLLAYYGYTDLDVPTVRGADRRITRWISRWAYEQRDTDNRPMFAGVRYLSRLSTEWECWAVFDDVALDEQERKPILRDDEALSGVAALYGLRVF